MQIRQIVKNALISIENTRYLKRLANQKLSYGDWAKRQEAQKIGKGMVKQEEFLVFFLNGGKLHEKALDWMGQMFSHIPEAKILYGDEDVMVNGERSNPFVKPCWSPDTYKSYFYLGGAVAVRTSLLEEVHLLSEMKAKAKKGIVAFETIAEFRMLMDTLVEAAGGFEVRGNKCICRIPRVLYHVNHEKDWDIYFESSYSKEEGKKENYRVSVVIPSKDNPLILTQCIDSLRMVAKDAEIIVVDNGSNDVNKEEVLKLVGEENYIYEPMIFNFAHMCNLGAKKAKGNLLLFLNDDIEVVDGKWYEAMCQKALEPYVGAVGLKLYYPNSTIIQHAGVVNLPVGPDHKLQRSDDKNTCYFMWNRFSQNRLAVTAACLMIEKCKFEEIHGFCEELQVNYNDVDLCMSLYEAGYSNVVLNDYYGYHHESLSRGNNDNPKKAKQIQDERMLMYERHPSIGDSDPYYVEEMDRYGLNTRILPAYKYASFKIQEGNWKENRDWMTIPESESLMNRVEISDHLKIQGYGLVLWDNNACYEMELLLCPENTEGEEGMLDPSRPAYLMKLDGIYRYELEENVPDQVNVALGGYCIKRSKGDLPVGSYRVGMIAMNKVNGSKLRSWSGRSIQVN